MSRKNLPFLALLLALVTLTGCYQAHSDDDLRTVPATNNPNLIQDSNRSSRMPSMGY